VACFSLTVETLKNVLLTVKKKKRQGCEKSVQKAFRKDNFNVFKIQLTVFRDVQDSGLHTDQFLRMVNVR
jgi:hypothetical protein